MYIIINEILMLAISIIALITVKHIPNIPYYSILNLGFIIIIALFTGKLFKRVHLPAITGYMVAGLIISPFTFNLTPLEYIKEYKIIDYFAITFIGMQAGSEMTINALKKNFKVIFSLNIAIIIISAIGTLLFLIPFGKYIFHTSHDTLKYIYAMMIIFGIAKSPVTTIAIINETKIKNYFTQIILGLTIIKDIVLIVVFTIVIGFIETSLQESGAFSIKEFLPIIYELFGSIFIGWFIALLINIYMKFLDFDSELFIIIFAFIISLIAEYSHINPLITGIAIGFFLENFSETSGKFAKSLKSISSYIYILFFPLASAVLNIRIVKIVIIPVIILLILRKILLIASFKITSKFIKLDKYLENYGWMGLINQSGITLALAIIVGDIFANYGMNETGDYIKTIAIASIIITDFYGPPLFKYAVLKSRKYFS